MALPSIIVTGPQGCGKTRNGELLQRHFKLDRVIEADELLCGHVKRVPHQGALILATEHDAHHLAAKGIRAVPFRDAMRQAGAKGH